MMRKDVRIGFGIGAVLLAVLIVYGLITSGPESREVTLAADPETPDSVAGDRAGNSSSPSSDVSSTARNPVQPAEEGRGAEPGAPGSVSNPSSTPPANSRDGSVTDRWEHALTRGELPPMLMTRTPAQPSGAGVGAPAGAAPVQPAPAEAGVNPASADSPAGSDGTAGGAPDPSSGASNPLGASSGANAPNGTNPASGTHAGGAAIDANELAQLITIPTTQPGDEPARADLAGQRTHVVQRNETFASIAHMVYGSESYYPHLMRANPNIDPKKLRAGMTIILPAVDQVVARTPGAADALGAAPSEASIDQTTHYRVLPSDSLYKISLKLYGRADKVDAIYQLNAEAIGPNPSRLRPGLVLKLPDPPAQSASSVAVQ